MSRDGTHARIQAVVREIPKGKVATYGQVAELAGLPRQARLVGYALHALPRGSGVPWQRVLNAKGEISGRSEPDAEKLQRAMLEREGIRFGENGRVDLARYRWTGPTSQRRSRPSPRRRSRPRAASPS